MRIVHVANFYGPNSGGIKTTLHELGKGYQEFGHEFIYIVPGVNSVEEITPYGRKITVPGLLLPQSGGYRIIRCNGNLKNLLTRLKPDRLEVSDRFTLLSLGTWAQENGIPSVVFSHETLRGLVDRFLPVLPHFLKTKFVNKHNRKLASSFDHVVATTNFASKEFIEIGIQNLIRISLGVDLHTFHPNLRSEELRSDLLKGSKVLLVHCGRMSREKEPHRSIDALEILLKKGISARLVYVGTGPLWHKLRKKAEGLPVDFLGYIADRNKVARILASADISMAPGPLETFCLAALESLASGTPVVASSSSAVGEFLINSHHHPAGATAEDQRFSFAHAVIHLLKRPRLRITAREVAEALPWDATVRNMLVLHGALEPQEDLPPLIVKPSTRMRVA
jgi:alpha-1,6-mannosyltransferase